MIRAFFMIILWGYIMYISITHPLGEIHQYVSIIAPVVIISNELVNMINSITIHYFYEEEDEEEEEEEK